MCELDQARERERGGRWEESILYAPKTHTLVGWEGWNLGSRFLGKSLKPLPPDVRFKD